MSRRAYALTTGFVFLLIAGADLLRLEFRWEVTIAGHSIPTWVSWAAFVIAVYLASEGFRHAKKTK